MRPSDAFRRRTVAALGRDYADGRMGSDTFEARLDRAFVARSRMDLVRAPGCDLVLRHDTISRRHAELVREGGRWMLRDLGSTNGTWDGAWRVSETEIDAGSELHLGRVPLRFRT